MVIFFWRNKISFKFFIFPGLSRIFAAPASIASIARCGLKWMSAIRGTVTFWMILVKAVVSARVGTATRTSLHPVLTSCFICRTHPSTSVVRTFVIDWITTGYRDPIRSVPTCTVLVFLRLIITRQDTPPAPVCLSQNLTMPVLFVVLGVFCHPERSEGSGFPM